jgi:uncharacterized membrane protein YedE/YeeE
MLLWFLSALALSEAVIGFTLTILLLLGKTGLLFVVDTLSTVGLAIAAIGIFPLLSRLSRLALGEPATEDEKAAPQAGTGSNFRTFIEQSNHLLRAILIGGIVIGTGLGLFYFPAGS